MSKPTVATLSAQIEALEATNETQWDDIKDLMRHVKELSAEIEALKAARPAQAAQPQAAARPVAQTKVEGDPKARSAPIFARDAAYAMGNVLGVKCWVQPTGAGFKVTKGPNPLPADEMTSIQLMDYVRQIRAAAVPMAA